MGSLCPPSLTQLVRKTVAEQDVQLKATVSPVVRSPTFFLNKTALTESNTAKQNRNQVALGMLRLQTLPKNITGLFTQNWDMEKPFALLYLNWF